MNVQLIDTESGAHLWADRFDTDRVNLAEAQEEMTGRLARTLNLELVEAVGRQIEQEKALNPVARDLVMRGWADYYRPRSVASLAEAGQAFERALELYPRSVDARIGVAAALVANLLNGWSRSFRQDQARAEQLLLEALERDSNLSVAHHVLGTLRRSQNRLTEARIEFEKAITLNRNHAPSYSELGQTLMFLGDPEAGIPHVEKALRLNPRDRSVEDYFAALGSCHLLLGHVDQATDLLRMARAENPRYW